MKTIITYDSMLFTVKALGLYTVRADDIPPGTIVWTKGTLVLWNDVAAASKLAVHSGMGIDTELGFVNANTQEFKYIPCKLVLGKPSGRSQGFSYGREKGVIVAEGSDSKICISWGVRASWFCFADGVCMGEPKNIVRQFGTAHFTPEN